MKMGAISPENPSQLTRKVGKSLDASLEAMSVALDCFFASLIDPFE